MAYVPETGAGTGLHAAAAAGGIAVHQKQQTGAVVERCTVGVADACTGDEPVIHGLVAGRQGTEH